MARGNLVADQLGGGDNLPTWLVAILSVIGTVAGWSAWKPIGGWAGRRIEAAQQLRAAERGDLVSQLKTQLQATVTEMMELRQDLGEERELRMALAVDNAVLHERVEQLTKAMAEDKEECRREIRRLHIEINELRRGPREGPS